MRAPQQGSLKSRRPLSRLLRMLVCLFQGTRDHWSLILPFSRAPCATLPGQVQAIALERNELEALLFDMNAAPNKKHGELLDKYVCVHVSGVVRGGCKGSCCFGSCFVIVAWDPQPFSCYMRRAGRNAVPDGCCRWPIITWHPRMLTVKIHTPPKSNSGHHGRCAFGQGGAQGCARRARGLAVQRGGGRCRPRRAQGEATPGECLRPYIPFGRCDPAIGYLRLFHPRFVRS